MKTPTPHSAPASPHDHDEASACCAACKAVGPRPRPHESHEHAHGHDEHDHDHSHGHTHDAHEGLPRLLMALALAVLAELSHFFAPETGSLPWTLAGMALAVAAIWLAGFSVYVQGLRSLRHGRLNISALMAVAVTGAFLIGQWPEAAMVMALYAIAEWIEERAVGRARDAIQGLLALAPETADVLQADGSWQAVALGDVPLGAKLRVRPGGRIPLDGMVAAGRSAVNQSAVTGESLPVDKALGDAVFAGTLNESGELEITVKALAGDSTLARIIHAVERAQATRAPMQKFVDQFARYYTPAVFAFALLVALFGPVLLGWSVLAALYKALVLLVIGCPCALVIATPVTVVSGLTAAARRGILIKGGVYLEQARRLRVIALDKTGTVTQGRPKLVAWQAWNGADEARARAIAASLAARSDHPVSQAIAQGLDVPHETVQDFKALAGRGTSGTVQGLDYWLGNLRLVLEQGLGNAELDKALVTHEQQGRTVTLLMDEQQVLALFAVADTIKPHAQEAIAQLKALGVRPVMLSGDNAVTARAVAAQAGIGDVQAPLLPEAKLQAVAELQAEAVQSGGLVGMAGDGINDAPALAAADLGFAMGAAGTDVAVETADVVVMNDDLRRIAETVHLSRRTHAVLWQNIGMALGIKAVFFVAALAGSATMWMAVFADVGASLLVVGNGLRMLGIRPEQPAPPR